MARRWLSGVSLSTPTWGDGKILQWPLVAEVIRGNHNVDSRQVVAAGFNTGCPLAASYHSLPEMQNMGYVTRKQYTRPLPDGAEIVTKKEGECAQWLGRNEKQCSAHVMIGRDGKPRIRVRASTYTAVYRDGLGVTRQHATGCRSKRSAEMVLAKLEQETEKVRAGVLTIAESEMAKYRDTPLSEHIESYITHQLARGVSEQWVKDTQSRLRRLCDECKMHRLTDLVADTLERWMLEKAELDERTGHPMGARTRNAYRGSMIGFANWLVKKKRLPADPFLAIPKANEKLDCRRKRRALNEDELRRLLDMTRRRPLEEVMTIRRGPNKGQLKANIRPEVRERLKRLGRERALIYKTMALTGLRKNELATLTIGCLELDADPPHLILDPNNEKNGEGNSLPLRTDLAEDLRAWIAEKPGEETHDNALVLKVPTGLLRVLDLDLQAAGISKKDSRGRTVDIHALRHTFGTMLSVAGVKPRTAQEVMRHSTLDLTMNVYTDPALLDTAGAVEALPSFPIGEGTKVAAEPMTFGLEESNTEQANDPTLVVTLVANTARPGQFGARPVRMAASDAARAELLSLAVKSCYDNSKGPLSFADNGPFKSGRKDSNLRPPAPKAGALARLRHAPMVRYSADKLRKTQ